MRVRSFRSSTLALFLIASIVGCSSGSTSVAPLPKATAPGSTPSATPAATATPTATPTAAPTPSPTPTLAGSSVASVPANGGPLALTGDGFGFTFTLPAGAFPSGTTVTYTFETPTPTGAATRRRSVPPPSGTIVDVTTNFSASGVTSPFPPITVFLPKQIPLPANPFDYKLELYDPTNPQAGYENLGGTPMYDPKSNTVNFTGFPKNIIAKLRNSVDYQFAIDEYGNIVTPSPTASAPTATPVPTPTPPVKTPPPTPSPSPTTAPTNGPPTPCPTGSTAPANGHLYVDDPSNGERILVFPLPLRNYGVCQVIAPLGNGSPGTSFSMDAAGDIAEVDNGGVHYLRAGTTTPVTLNLAPETLALGDNGKLYYCTNGTTTAVTEYTIGLDGSLSPGATFQETPNGIYCAAGYHFDADVGGDLHAQTITDAALGFAPAVAVYKPTGGPDVGEIGGPSTPFTFAVDGIHTDGAENLYIGGLTSEQSGLTFNEYSALAVGNIMPSASLNLGISQGAVWTVSQSGYVFVDYANLSEYKVPIKTPIATGSLPAGINPSWMAVGP